MNESKVIADFCRVLARVRRLFRESHIVAENSGRFANVSCVVSHAEKDLIGDERVDTVEVSFSIDCELREITSDGRYSLGASVAIYNTDNAWECCGDVGWSHREAGWEGFTSMASEFASLREMQNGLEKFVECVLRSHEQLVEEHFQKYPQPDKGPG